MRKLFESIVTVIGSVISLLLCIRWYLNTREIEPLVGIIGFSVVLLTALVYYLFPEHKAESPSSIPNADSNKPEISKTFNISQSDMKDEQSVTNRPKTAFKRTEKGDTTEVEAALNSADFHTVLDLLDAHYGNRPSIQYSTLRQYIVHALSQGQMPNPPTVMGLKVLIEELKTREL
jgi:flagellar hook-basal body complex protein FliE